jgi:PAS domain S-box-containing protein
MRGFSGVSVSADYSWGFLSDGGRMGALIRAHDWAGTPMGPIAGWPVAIKTSVGLLLRSPVPIVALFGPEGTMIYNDAYSVFAGGRHPRLLGSEVRKGWPEVADFNDNVMKVVFHRGETLSYRDQALTLHRSGVPEEVFMDLDYSPVVGEDGRPVGVIAIVVETTDMVVANRRIAEGAARLAFLDALGRETAPLLDADAILGVTTRMLGQHLGVSVCAYADMEPDGDHFTIRGDWVTPGSSSIVGHYRLADFGGLAVARLSAGLPLIVDDIPAGLAPEEAATFQAIGIAATICMPLVKEGRLTALMAVHHRQAHHWDGEELALLREVTERCWAHIERARAASALLESEAQFRLFAEAMPNHVWTAPPAGLLDWFNEQVYVYCGARPGELDGEGWTRIVHPDDIGKAALSWREAVASGEDYQAEFRIRRYDGEWRWFLARAVAIRRRDGQILRWIGTNTDVDDQKNLESLLEERLAERSATLANAHEQLRQAQKMEAIGNLTGGVAHDFNNLLMAVSGSLELMKKRIPDDPVLARLMNTAIEGAARGRSLTQRMLAFARRQELKVERIDVAQLIGGTVELLGHTLGAMVTIETHVADGLARVATDAHQLETALINLAVNARDAMGGKGHLIVTADEQRAASTAHGLLAGERYVRIAVADTGEGMDAETLLRATEPFFTTKGVGKGTGLGLSMVHGFAEQSGGALVLRSEPGIGTTAEIWLPRLDGAAAEPAGAVQPLPPAPAGGRGRRLKVLVVDDDALVLMNTVSMLEDLGHEVTEAGSGRRALDKLDKAGFDIVITDHAMPNMTGAQLVEAMRERGLDTPIILATGYAELPAGGDDNLPRLSKPFSQDELRVALARAFA